MHLLSITTSGRPLFGRGKTAEKSAANHIQAYGAAYETVHI